MEECLGANGRQLFVIWKSDSMCCWCNVVLQNTFYGRPCNFRSVPCILSTN